jgi:hypothetical protein
MLIFSVFCDSTPSNLTNTTTTTTITVTVERAWPSGALVR